MKVVFGSDREDYPSYCWPIDITIPPRKGDLVMVSCNYQQSFISKNMPIVLKVVEVLWTDYEVVCKLN